jgi:NAD(P)H-flavin reductase
LFEVYAPDVAAKSLPGQFVIVIVGEKGERVPLTICGYNSQKGTAIPMTKAMPYHLNTSNPGHRRKGGWTEIKAKNKGQSRKQ